MAIRTNDQAPPEAGQSSKRKGECKSDGTDLSFSQPKQPHNKSPSDLTNKITERPISHESTGTKKTSVTYTYRNRIPTPTKASINYIRRRMAKPRANEVRPTIYLAGRSTFLRSIAKELEKLLEPAWSMDAAELKPLVSDWGYWKTCVDDTVVVPQQANRHDDTDVSRTPIRADPDATTSLYSAHSKNTKLARLNDPATSKACTVIYDIHSPPKRITTETLLYHKCLAERRNSPFHFVVIYTSPAIPLLQEMTKAGNMSEPDLSKQHNGRRTGTRKHPMETFEDYRTRKDEEYILVATDLTATMAAEDIVKHFELKDLCSCQPPGGEDDKETTSSRSDEEEWYSVVSHQESSGPPADEDRTTEPDARIWTQSCTAV